MSSTVAKPKIFVVIYSLYGHIKTLSEAIVTGLKEEGVDATLYRVEEVSFLRNDFRLRGRQPIGSAVRKGKLTDFPPSLVISISPDPPRFSPDQDARSEV
ncbi:hypothetical protein BDK51DRAFT_45035 [Blyttiomyces helicus]|uniref:Flavodoxin-like domain-containing protein n=1 Tax=Blyttiomyces helicus TaxID=388810 RepID=A0A4P9WCQ0_9FUNG|nr:hypothetical protein BDK51DRAFT_45035 [Blyttiomyces helicus]|eukprot:RKO88680.1 hypothetical protein BDK51DRAFT_45035 [Blyttiomyces helicus]